MSTVVLGEQPEIADWLERRRALGQDGMDEVWEGVYHVAPLEQPQNSIVAVEILTTLYADAKSRGLTTMNPFNLGTDIDNFRCPDGGWIKAGSPLTLYLPTAVAVLEVLSPDDKTYKKFPFYAERGVEEILVAHPTERWIKCYRRDDNGVWQEYLGSAVFEVLMSELQEDIDWP